MSKLNKIKQYMEQRQWKEALEIAAKFPHLGCHRDPIQKAWAAIRNPEFYREIGIDPDEAIKNGVRAIRERWGI